MTSAAMLPGTTGAPYGAYINGALGKLPEGAAKHELYPAAIPTPLKLSDRFLVYSLG